MTRALRPPSRIVAAVIEREWKGQFHPDKPWACRSRKAENSSGVRPKLALRNLAGSTPCSRYRNRFVKL